MPVTLVQYLIWFLVPAVMLAIAVIMYRRDLRSQFPFFFTYCVFQVLSHLSMFFVYRYAGDDQYFYGYWVTTALSIFLGFFVIYEVFSYVIRPYPGLRDLGTMLFRWAVLLLLLVTGISAATSSGPNKLIQEIVNLERSVRLVQCGLLLFVVMCSSHLGLSWRNFACGVAFGFGLFAATDLILYNIRATQGAQWNQTLSVISTSIYVAAAAIWFGFSLVPQHIGARNDVVYRPAFDRWNQAAMLIMNSQQAEDSTHTYISDIEQTVEAVLAQSGKAS